MGRLLRLAGLLTVIVFAANLAVVGASRLTYRDPFAHYAALMPGQSMDGLKDYPCQFLVAPGRTTAIGDCEFSAADGVFQHVSLTAEHHFLTQMVVFDLLPDALRLGDLILCWGKPYSITNDYPNETLSLDIYWKSQMHVQLAPSRYGARLDYFLPVSYLAISGDWQPCESDE